MAEPQLIESDSTTTLLCKAPPLLTGAFSRFDDIRYQKSIIASQGYGDINFHYTKCVGGVDETGYVFGNHPDARLEFIEAGLLFKISDLANFKLHPLPFRTGFDGLEQSIEICEQTALNSYAEAWLLEDGMDGYLAMRIPTASPETCFVPVRTLEMEGVTWLQFGSYGMDGGNHKTINCYAGQKIGIRPLEMPVTRFIRYSGGWEKGVAIYKSILEEILTDRLKAYRSSPITYNTFHDFGPCYSREQLFALFPELNEMGFRMLHLDPGWETVWGSTKWDHEKFGAPADLVNEARKYKIEVGCWTSFHTISSEAHEGSYTIGMEGKPFLAEEFGEIKLYGVCPESPWRKRFLTNLGELAEAGFTFINSDFHDWPWSGESCQSADHLHSSPLTRTEWTESVDSAFRQLKSHYPNLKIEMHDHVESGEYRTPVWYLYLNKNGFDEKWAYEFMWTTYDDLINRKLFSLYHLRKAQPVPLYLHMNMIGDNHNALAFWYVASCVQHIGVGGLLKAAPAVRDAYREAISFYNQHTEVFGTGQFIGIDELNHVHVSPSGTYAIFLAFNITDQTEQRKVSVEINSMQFEPVANIQPFSVDIQRIELT